MNASFLENSNRWLKELYNKTDSKEQKIKPKKKLHFQKIVQNHFRKTEKWSERLSSIFQFTSPVTDNNFASLPQLPPPLPTNKLNKA